MPAVLSFDPTPRNTGPSRGPTAAKKLCYDHLQPTHIHERGKSWQEAPPTLKQKMGRPDVRAGLPHDGLTVLPVHLQ
jgi:hypothetical protein